VDHANAAMIAKKPPRCAAPVEAHQSASSRSTRAARRRRLEQAPRSGDAASVYHAEGDRRRTRGAQPEASVAAASVRVRRSSPPARSPRAEGKGTGRPLQIGLADERDDCRSRANSGDPEDPGGSTRPFGKRNGSPGLGMG
jgi:hypothetical protein